MNVYLPHYYFYNANYQIGGWRREIPASFKKLFLGDPRRNQLEFLGVGIVLPYGRVQIKKERPPKARKPFAGWYELPACGHS